MSDEKVELEKIPPTDDAMLVRAGYPRPMGYPEPYGYRYDQDADSGAINLREMWRTVRKRKWLILITVIIVTTVVTIEVYRIKSTYQASATIEIAKDSTTLVKTADVIVQTDDSDSLRTKMVLLKSRPLLRDVVLNLNLDQNPRFLDVTQRKSLWEALKTIGNKVYVNSNSHPLPEENTVTVESTAGVSPTDNARLKPYVDVLATNLSVEEIPDTRLILVSFTHTEPNIAAAVANGVAKDFIERGFKNQTEKFTKTSEWLESTTRELQSKMKQAEQAMANYTREHGIFSTEGKETLTTDKLARLHDQVMRAETDRILKQSLYEEVKQGRVAQLPEAFTDQKMAALEAKLGELKVKAAQLDIDFGPNNPQVVDVKKQMTVIQEQIDGSRKTLEEKLRADFERAARDEASLKSALERAKNEAVQQNQDTIQYNILKQDVDTAKALYTEFLQKTNQADIQVAEQHNNMRVAEPAEIPMAPVGPQRLRAILIGFFLSLVGGIALALFLERFDNTIKTVEDVSRYAQLPALSVIPAIQMTGVRKLLAKAKEKGTLAAGETQVMSNGESQLRSVQLVALENRSSAAEAYRMLRTSVLLSAAGRPPKTILVTSGEPGEGKTTTAINTAISLAQLGASVLIIDCDLRKPTTHTIFGMDHMTGLSTYLSREIEVEGLIHKLEIPNLSLLPCGPIPPNPAELISSDKMKNLLQMMGERYDHILIDSPPLISVTDPVILSTMVDGVILVVHGGKSTRDVVRRARQDLASVGAKIFGVVLNNVDLRREGYDEYYYYPYYSDNSGMKEEDIKGVAIDIDARERERD